MAANVKIAVCCYCGTRAALAVGEIARDGLVRHELACASCGAPISVLKRFKSPAAPAPTRRPAPPPARAARTPPLSPSPPRKSPPKKKKRRPPKRRRHSLVEILDDLFDDLEDLFD